MQTTDCVFVWGFGKMPAGFQTFDEAGNVLVDLSTRLTRITGEGTTTPNVAGAVMIPGVISSTPFFIVLTTPHYPFNSVNTVQLPTFTLNDNILSWTAEPGSASFMYGAY